uniref:Lipoyl-binding domain-containing protein n=1 Tax=Globodera pallida TaxID=36090 RepID=A0A183CSF6_GLOPA
MYAIRSYYDFTFVTSLLRLRAMQQMVNNTCQALAILRRFFVKKGDYLAKDQPIVAISVMKMEFVI